MKGTGVTSRGSTLRRFSRSYRFAFGLIGWPNATALGSIGGCQFRVGFAGAALDEFADLAGDEFCFVCVPLAG